MSKRSTVGVCSLAFLLAGGVAACDRPGPLSAAARGTYPPPPPVPAWAAPYAGRPLRDSFPTMAKCVGFVDGLTDRYNGARKAQGWAWSPSLAQPVRRLAVVSADGRMVGFGEGGGERPDVPAVRPEISSRATGWTLVAPAAQRRYTVYGLDEASRSACEIGAPRL